MRKPEFAYAKTKAHVTAKLISAFVFTTRIVQSLYLLNPKFQASSYLKPGLCKVPKTESLIFAQEPNFGLIIVFVLFCFLLPL